MEKRKNESHCQIKLMDLLSVLSLLKGCLVASPRKIVNGIRNWDSNLRGNSSNFSSFNLLIHLIVIELALICIATQSPVYVAEITPKAIRGGFIAVIQVHKTLKDFY